MIIDPLQITARDRHKIAIGSVLPRPIAWVSTQDAAGQLNLAPYSFFSVASSDPFTLLFCPQLKGDGSDKDTLRNIERTGEFVVNLTNEETARAMSKTAALLPPGESEFDYAGLSPTPSATISVPRVAEAPLAFECVLHQIVRIGQGATVFGTVQSIYIRDDIYSDGYILLERFNPVGRLAGNAYARVSDVFEMTRG